MSYQLANDNIKVTSISNLANDFTDTCSTGTVKNIIEDYREELDRLWDIMFKITGIPKNKFDINYKENPNDINNNFRKSYMAIIYGLK